LRLGQWANRQHGNEAQSQGALREFDFTIKAPSQKKMRGEA
jgi:hypothetical protein